MMKKNYLMPVHTHTHGYLKNKKEKGITLVALVITIIVLLILAGVTITMVVGDNGILTRAREAKFKQEIAGYLEEFELWKSEKTIGNYGTETEEFDDSTLLADSTRLEYNSQKQEGQTIKNIINSFKDEYNEKFLILGGKMYVTALATENEIKWSQDLGIIYLPLDLEISDGEVKVLSTSNNLGYLSTEKSIIIPSMVTTIAAGTFNGVNAETVIIPPTVRIIEKNAFSNNKNIKHVIFDDIENSQCEYIGYAAFYNSGIEEIILPNSVKEIENYAFASCKSLQSITLSNQLEKLPAYFLQSCVNLTAIEVPEGIKEIEELAFYKCTLLKEITLPPTLTSMEAGIFYGTSNLEKVNIDDNPNFIYDDLNKMILNTDKTVLYTCFTNLLADGVVNIPDTVQTIPKRIFTDLDRNNLKIKIPSSVKTIERAAFSTNDISATFEVNNDKYSATEGGKGLYDTTDMSLIRQFTNGDDKIEIQEGIKLISGSCLYSDTATSLVLPSTLINLDVNSLSSLKKVTSIVLPNELESCSYAVFNYSIAIELKWKDTTREGTNYMIRPFAGQAGGCLISKDGTLITVTANISNDIKASDFPEGITSIGKGAFYGKYSKSLELPETIKTLETQSFWSSAIKKIWIPSSVTSIESGCFALSGLNNTGSICIDKEEGSISGSPWSAPSGDRTIMWSNSSTLNGKTLEQWYEEL